MSLKSLRNLSEIGKQSPELFGPQQTDSAGEWTKMGRKHSPIQRNIARYLAISSLFWPVMYLGFLANVSMSILLISIHSMHVALGYLVKCTCKCQSRVKTKGYHLEHNFGHGKRYLAALLLSLNLLAFLFHTVLTWCDAHYALIRQVLARRQTFFDDLRALTRYMVFESWQHLMDFMIEGLELETDLQGKLDTS